LHAASIEAVGSRDPSILRGLVRTGQSMPGSVACCPAIRRASRKPDIIAPCTVAYRRGSVASPAKSKRSPTGCPSSLMSSGVAPIGI